MIARGLQGITVDETEISLVDGDSGTLAYRGHHIDDLVDRPFDEVAALVATGAGDADFAAQLTAAGDLSRRETQLIQALPRSLHPMHVLQGVTPLLDPSDAFSEHGQAAQGFAVAAKLPAIIACHMLGKPTLAQEPSYTDRFLAMIGTELTPVNRRAFAVTQILQIEHGFNASSFAARVTASTLAPVQNALSTGFGTLHGALHGGADQAALETAESVGSPDHAKAFVDQCITDKRRVMGMGHREYRVLDPRARHIKRIAAEVSRGTHHEVTFQTLLAIEARFRERMAETNKQLHANVEFYKGVVYRVLGLTPEYFTAGFAMARVFGYLAHFIESRKDNRLIRPAARYVGPSVEARRPTPA